MEGKEGIDRYFMILRGNCFSIVKSLFLQNIANNLKTVWQKKDESFFPITKFGFLDLKCFLIAKYFEIICRKYKLSYTLYIFETQI